LAVEAAARLQKNESDLSTRAQDTQHVWSIVVAVANGVVPCTQYAGCA